MTFDLSGSTDKISVRCEVCDSAFEGVAQDAYNLGWDVAPWFKGYVKCHNCPIGKTAFFIFHAGHES